MKHHSAKRSTTSARPASAAKETPDLLAKVATAIGSTLGVIAANAEPTIKSIGGRIEGSIEDMRNAARKSARRSATARHPRAKAVRHSKRKS